MIIDGGSKTFSSDRSSNSADVTTTTPGSVVHFTVTATNTGQTAYSAASFADPLSAILDDATAAYLGILAATLVAESNVVALLASRAAGHVVFAQTKSSSNSSAAGSSSASDLGALLRDSIKDFGGKGGGSKDFAQGSLPNPADAERAVQRAQSMLSSK